MRHRITYISDPKYDLNADALRPASQGGLIINSLYGCKEHRVTIGITELPVEFVTGLLEQSHELHIRWQSLNIISSHGPYTSRVTPGLHVSFTPREGEQGDNLCPTLKLLFSSSLKCDSYQKAFSKPPVLSTRFATSASSQYYSSLPSLLNLVDYLQSNICSSSDHQCINLAKTISTVSQLDADYDAISHSLVISAYWSGAPVDGAWKEDIGKIGMQGERIEVGVFNQESAPSPEDIKLGGWVAVAGEVKNASTTLFSFPSRHHTLTSSSVRISLDQPTGLHPTLRLSVATLPPPANPTCSLHAYLTLPSPIFLDRYAFTDPLILASHNLASLRSISGATDLEAPNWAIGEWGSAILFELSLPKAIDAEKTPTSFDMTVPLHLRYMSPVSGGYSNVTFPRPVVFWACRVQDDEAPPLSTNPFDRRNLGYDGLFSDQTIFYHVPALQTHDSTTLLSFPVLDIDKTWYVQSSTVAVVTLGSLWLLWKLFGPVTVRPRSSSIHEVYVEGRK